MAKTYPWSTIVPSGSDQASTADDHIRRLRLEIEERMNDIVEDWSADPVVLQTALVTGNKIIIHPTAFIVEPTDESVQYGDNNLEVTSSTNPMRAPIQARPGLVLSKMRALVTHPGGGGEIIVALKSLAFNSGLAVTTICQLVTASDGIQTLDSTDLDPFSHTVAEDESLFLAFDISSVTGKLHGVELTYDAES